jgi:hypothetical protein
VEVHVPGKSVSPTAKLDGLLDPFALVAAERGNESPLIDLGTVLEDLFDGRRQ